MEQKLTRLNKTLMTLGYSVKVEDDKVYVFNAQRKLAFRMDPVDFQYWALELTAERAVTEYIMACR